MPTEVTVNRDMRVVPESVKALIENTMRFFKYDAKDAIAWVRRKKKESTESTFAEKMCLRGLKIVMRETHPTYGRNSMRADLAWF